MKVLISRRAAEDLAGLHAWQAIEHRISAAEQFKVRVEAALDLLRCHPQAGPQPAWDTRHQNLRYWVISRTPCVIYYEYHPGEVSIERVLHSRRDVRRILETRLEEPPPEE